MIEFAQPLALWTGLLVGLPVLAHLAYRRIAQKIPFSSLRFLRSSTIPRSGRKKPSDLWLLLLRVLFFILLTLILADPYWQDQEKVLPNPTASSECLFLFDTTASMAGWGAWEEAVSLVRARILDGENEKYGLLASQGGALIELPTGSSVADLESTLTQISHQPTVGGLQAVLDHAPSLFSQDNTSKKIVIVSDFQKSSWQERSSKFSELGIEVVLLPVGHGDAPWQRRSGNRAIVDSRVASGGEDKVRIWAALRNWDDVRSDVNVSLFAGGQIRQTVVSNLPPLGSTQVQFTLPSKDFAQATLQLDGEDSYAYDNNQSLWVLPPLPRAFGFWKSNQGSPADKLEEQFLRAAMESSGDGEWDTWVENKQRASDLKNEASGRSLDFLMVLGLSGWFEDDGLAPPLINFLTNGGKALVTPPDEAYVRMNRVLKKSDLINFTFGGLNRTAFRMEPYRIDALQEGNRLNRVFSGDSIRDLYLTEIRQFITVGEVMDLDIPLRDRSGHPLVLVRTFPNGGKLVFSTFRMVPQWSDLPMRNSFLPLVAELCDVKDRDPQAGGVLRVESGQSSAHAELRIDATKFGLVQQGEQRIEVVHPLVESYPEVMNPYDLLDALTGTSTAGEMEAEIENIIPQESQPLWQWFALAAFVLLLLETLFSAPFYSNTQKQEVQSA